MNIHASCVALGGRGLLILGDAGAGKSTLALAMMALGAGLVADDRTDLYLHEGRLFADAPASLRGMIEARGVGILIAEAKGPIEVTLAVDLSQTETERLPLWQERAFLGVKLPLVRGPMRPHLEAALMQYLAKGRAL
ncbi:serine kinase [Paracoccus sp. (in: a-proteobacteria)]|uniref:HPr kinase/phosphorylase n=1 Tax=Paracoccus sp. TaxID=267 RepID=UPI0028A2BD76|nr:serine kinase [Paracoccus sp. (in: a-proteobacteria)]